MAGLQFITQAASPIDAYRKGQEAARQADLGEAQLANEQARLARAEALAPIEVDRARTGAQREAAELGEYTAHAPYRTQTAEAGARQAVTTADRAGYEFGEFKGQADNRAAQADAATRQARAQATNTEMQRPDQFFEQSMAALKAGDANAAQMWAQRGGSKIPDAILNDANMQRTVVTLWDDAKRLYPNSPARQQQFIMKGLEGARDATTGQVRYRADVGVNVPGAPKPDMVSSSSNSQPADVETATWLAERTAAAAGRPVTDQDYVQAFQLISTAKSNPEARAKLVLRAYEALNEDFSDTRSPEEKWTAANQQVDQLLAPPSQGLSGVSSATPPDDAPAGVPLPPELTAEPDGTIVEDESGRRYQKQGNALIPVQ